MLSILLFLQVLFLPSSPVTPLLKKPGLDSNDLTNFKPLSNLSFISKSFEKVVWTELKNYLPDNSLLKIFQFAYTYRQDYSTKTAVWSVLDGLLGSADEVLVSLVALLDLSAVFDTLEHSLLLKRSYGRALKWLASSLSDSFQSASVDGILTVSRPLVYGVPQGSVVGSVLFTLYSQPLSDVISVHICDYHKYTDDTELSIIITLIIIIIIIIIVCPPAKQTRTTFI